MGKPKIRFKGFDDDWEQRKFSELYSKVSEKNDLSFGADKIISVANMYFKEEVKESSDEYMRTYNVMRLGDIAFEGNKSKNYSHGRFVENTIGDGIVSHVFDVFRPTTSYDLLFWKYLINNEGIMGRIMARCTNASTMMTNLVASDFLKEKILVPSLKEQKKIGAYFDSLDHLITLHQRKCDETKKLKNYMLQKMFPQNGQTVPEIRFSGFTDVWEQRKLGEIITEYKETVDSNCTLPILTSSKTEGVILQEDHFGRKQQHDITGYNILPRNYCTYRNRSDGVDFTFNINKCCDKGIISKFYPVFSGKNSDVFFLALVLNNSDEVVREIAYTCTGTGQKVLSFLDLQKMNVKVPSFDEQKEIAAYFDSLDQLITLHQQKCDELRNIKKFMLQNMFA